MTSPLKDKIGRIVERSMRDSGSRFILGIAGTPGSGKTTMAANICDDLNEALGEGFASYIPMDGFHLSNLQLEKQGILEDKGKPHTFDVEGFVSLLSRCKAPGQVVYAPGFSHTLSNPIAASICVPADCQIIVTEGNYLLFDGYGWSKVLPYLDETWFIDESNDILRSRLVSRQISKGKTAQEADAWFNIVDRGNIDMVRSTKNRADCLITKKSN